MRIIESNSILFVGKREFRLLSPSTWVSNLIYLFQGKITHTAVTFVYNNTIMIREMGKSGVVIESLASYNSKYGHRILAVYNVIADNPKNITFYNKECLNTDIKYDFTNLLFRQPLHFIFGYKSKTITELNRICSEDTAMNINILTPMFEDVENLSPQELYTITDGRDI